jgi:cytochrome c oxidase subunit IV
MEKATILYLIFIPNLILMVYTLMDIYKRENLTGYRRNALIYTTILFPVVGLAFLHIPVEKNRFNR